MDRRSRNPRQYRRKRREPAPTRRKQVSGKNTVFDFEIRSEHDEDYGLARRLARREARQKDRLRRRRLRYFLFGALLLGIVGTAIALQATGETPVQTVTTPTIASAVPPPKPAPPEATLQESASAAAEVPEQKDSGLAGNPDALKKRIEEIAISYGGTYGVLVSDPVSEETASLGADETFFAASIGKIPALLSLYKSAAQGEMNLDDKISMLASDVQSYGTGVLHTYPVGHTITLRECAYYLMHDSDNTAWKMLTRYLGVERIQTDLTSIGAYDTGYWIPNTTTTSDVQLMLQKIADPSFTSPELSEEMLSAMTDTVHEDRIPAGLPQDVRVAHKIGTYENSFSDAGIVFYRDREGSEKHYFIVVFTEGAGEATARAAIREISAAAHQTFGPAVPNP